MEGKGRQIPANSNSFNQNDRSRQNAGQKSSGANSIESVHRVDKADLSRGSSIDCLSNVRANKFRHNQAESARR